MLKFTPPTIRGLGQACFKHSSVRNGGLNQTDAELFDMIDDSYARISQRKQTCDTVHCLQDSITEIRELQRFLNETYYSCNKLCSLCGTESVINFVAEGIAYYMGRMHATDARVLKKQTPLFLREDFTCSQIQTALLLLSRCTEQMCLINTKVILSALKG